MHNTSHGLIAGSTTEDEELDPRGEDSQVNTERAFPAKSSLAFITYTNPQEAKGSSTRRLVRSHALKDYHAKRSQQRKAAQKTEASHKPRSKDELVRSKEVKALGSVILSPAQYDFFLANSSPKGIENQSGSFSTRILRQSTSPSPMGVLNAGVEDPFSSIPRVLNYYELLVLDYYIKHFCAKNDDLYPPEFSNALSRIWLPRAIKDIGMLDGMLLIAARDLMKVAPNKELGSLILQLRGRLIRDVNIAISDERRAGRDESIATLLQLAFDEISTGNQKALKSHVKALRLILKSRGSLPPDGFEGFLGFLIERVSLISTFYKPPEPVRERTPTPRDTVSIENLRPGFLAKEVINNISPELLTVLDNFCALSEYIESHPTAALPPVGSFQIEAAFSNHEAEWLLLFSHEKVAAQAFDDPDIEECMISAAGIYRSCILYENEAFLTHTPLSSLERKQFVENYMAGVLRINTSMKRTYYLPLLFWMVFVGSLLTKTATDYTFWPHMMHEIAKQLDITTWKGARSRLKSYLWLHRRCEEFGRELWHQVVQIDKIRKG